MKKLLIPILLIFMHSPCYSKCMGGDDKNFKGFVKIIDSRFPSCRCESNGKKVTSKTIYTSKGCILKLEPISPNKFENKKTREIHSDDLNLCSKKNNSIVKVIFNYHCNDTKQPFVTKLEDCKNVSPTNCKYEHIYSSGPWVYLVNE